MRIRVVGPGSLFRRDLAVGWSTAMLAAVVGVGEASKMPGAVVSGRVGSAVVSTETVAGVCGSVERIDALMRDEEIARGGPAVDDPHDVSARSPDDAGRCVPQAPTQPFRFGDREFTGAAQVLEPAHEISGDTDPVASRRGWRRGR